VKSRFLRAFLFLMFFALLGASSPTMNSTHPNSSNPIVASVHLSPGDYNLSLTTGGANRTYILHVPTAYNGAPLPLVYVLHGRGGSAQSMVTGTKMNLVADQKNFFVVYPNGTGNPRAWNNGILPLLVGSTVDDVAFFRALTADLQTRIKIDTKKIYATGLSNGAFMSYRLGSEAPDLVAAIGIVEGTMSTTQNGTVYKIATPSTPLPVLVIHGKQDPNLPYNGGASAAEPGVSKMSPADSVKIWTHADACTGSPTEKTSPNGNIVIKDYQNCTGGTEVQFITIGSGLHQWPTLNDAAHFPGSPAIWNFLSKHAKS
jgi:polyhydroxybutyrate depolymerase